MSLEAKLWAEGREVGDSSAKFVLMILADRAGPDGRVAKPGLREALESVTELDRHEVGLALALLEMRGFIESVENHPGRPVYRLTLGE